MRIFLIGLILAAYCLTSWRKVKPENGGIDLSSAWLKIKKLMKDKKVEIGNPEEQFWNGLFQKDSNEDYIIYTSSYNGQPISIQIKKQVKEVTLDNVVSGMKADIDNTGFILWPSEEILAYLLIFKFDTQLSRYSRVLELGSGYNGLAGIIWSKLKESAKSNNLTNENQFQMISDGNSKCANDLWLNYKINIANHSISNMNMEDCDTNKQYITNLNNKISETKVRQFIFSDYQNFLVEDCQNQKFDFIMVADILFFKDSHYDLLDAIEGLLEKGGLCWIVGPNRDSTQDLFVERLSERKFLELKDLVNVKEMLLVESQDEDLEKEQKQRRDDVTKDIFLIEIRRL